MIEELINEALNKAIEKGIILSPYNYYKLFVEIALQKNIDLDEIKQYLYDENANAHDLDIIKEKISKIIANIKKETSNASNAISESLLAQDELHLDDAYAEIEKLKKINLALRMNLEKAIRNIDLEHQSLERIKVKIYHDKLTSLYLREYLEIKLKENLYYMERYGRIFSLLMLDIDDFKYVNDKYGHQIGDNVLGQIGNLIKQNIRSSDLAVRYGGDEFVVIMPETDLLRATDVAAKFLQKMSIIIFKKQEEEFRVTFSIGITSARATDTLKSIIERVDTALYSSKKAGKNSVTVFD